MIKKWKKSMKKTEQWGKKYYRVLFIVGFLIFLKMTYLFLQQFRPEGKMLMTFFDQIIPFTSFFVLFYVLYYPFIVLPLFLNVKRKSHFFRTLGAMFFITTSSFVMYILFQTSMIRPDIVITSIFDKMVQFIYLMDKPLNLFPSLHVSLTTAAFLSLRKTDKKKSGYFLPIALGIIVSTVLIKQHVVLDVLAGIVWGGVSYLLFFSDIPEKVKFFRFLSLTERKARKE